jgi:hypothetical protein
MDNRCPLCNSKIKLVKTLKNNSYYKVKNFYDDTISKYYYIETCEDWINNYLTISNGFYFFKDDFKIHKIWENNDQRISYEPNSELNTNLFIQITKKEFNSELNKIRINFTKKIISLQNNPKDTFDLDR